MQGIEILKRIYTSPMEAFDRQTLENSFQECLVWYFSYYVVSSGFTLWTNRAVQMSPGFVILGALIGFGQLLLTCWIAQVFIRGKGHTLPLKPLVAGLMWISIALAPLQFVMLMALRWLIWISAAITIGLATICVHRLSSLSLKSSFLILVVSFLVALAVGTVCFMAVGMGISGISKMLKV